MIKLENTEVLGWEAAIRGMRNPMNSWDKSDSWFYDNDEGCYRTILGKGSGDLGGMDFEIGSNDHKLMMNLAKAGSVDAKYRRMIVVYVDITAPLYWWKEFDTYKVGSVSNSCSTMHKIHAKEFTLEDFSYEHLMQHEEYINDIPNAMVVGDFKTVMDITIKALNDARSLFLETKDKRFWWQMIQLLPSSYNQRRTIMLNYEVLHNIYIHRKDHKLDEWRDFCSWIETLPYAELITLKEDT